MGDTYRPPEKRKRTDSPDGPKYRSFKDVRSSSHGNGRDAMSRDRSHSPNGPSKSHVPITNGIEEVVRKFVQSIRQSSAASARHDLALQRAESAQKEHDNMENQFTSYPAIADQKRNHVKKSGREVQDTKVDLEISEFALSKALMGIITTVNEQTKFTESSTSPEIDQDLRIKHEKVVSELDETKARCNKLEQQMEALLRSTGKQDQNQKFILDNQTTIRKEVKSVKGEVGVAQENRRRLERLQSDVEKQNKDIGRHYNRLEAYDQDFATLRKDGQGQTDELERQKVAMDKINASQRESSEQKAAQNKTSAALQELSERMNDLEAKSTNANMNINNEFAKHQRSLESLSSAVTEKASAPSTTSLPDPIMQGEINAIKSAIQVLQRQADNQENKTAITALGQRVLLFENDALHKVEALGRRMSAIESVVLPKWQALEPRVSTIEIGASSKAHSQAMQHDIEAMRTTVQELKAQDGTANKATFEVISRRLSVIEEHALPKTQASTMQDEINALKTYIQELNGRLGNEEKKQDIATLWQRFLAVESGVSSRRQLPAKQSEIEALRAEIQEVKRRPSQTAAGDLGEALLVRESNTLQSLEQRLSALEVYAAPLKQEMYQRFELLDEENAKKDEIYDSVVTELEDKFEELREASGSSIRDIHANIGPMHAAINHIQESIDPIHAAIQENRDGFVPIHQAIDKMGESLATVQETVKQLEKRPLAIPVIPTNAATANTITNGNAHRPSVDRGIPGRSLDQQKLDQQKLDTLGYAVGDLERRFSNIQTDELANQMVDQMKKLYPAPANLQQTVDSINKKFQSLAGQTKQALEVRNGKIDATGARADDAKAKASAAAAKAEDCNSHCASLDHEVQELKTVVQNHVAALPKISFQDTTQGEQALLDVRKRVNKIEMDLERWASLGQKTASRLNTVDLEKLKGDHQTLVEKVSELKDEIARVDEETARSEKETARVESTLMTACSGQEMQIAVVQGVIEEIAGLISYGEIKWD